MDEKDAAAREALRQVADRVRERSSHARQLVTDIRVQRMAAPQPATAFAFLETLLRFIDAESVFLSRSADDLSSAVAGTSRTRVG